MINQCSITSLREDVSLTKFLQCAELVACFALGCSGQQGWWIKGSYVETIDWCIVKELTPACILLSDMALNYGVWLMLMGECLGCNYAQCGLVHSREVWSELCNTHPKKCTVVPLRWDHDERRKMRRDKKSRGIENRWVVETSVEMRKVELRLIWD